MNGYEDDADLEMTDEQVQLLRDLGAEEREIQGMSVGEAQALIDELRGIRDAARTGNL